MQNSNKNTTYVEDNNTNIYAIFQLHPTYDFWEEYFWIFFFRKFNISVAMATYQYQRLEQNSYGL